MNRDAPDQQSIDEPRRGWPLRGRRRSEAGAALRTAADDVTASADAAGRHAASAESVAASLDELSADAGRGRDVTLGLAAACGLTRDAAADAETLAGKANERVAALELPETSGVADLAEKADLLALTAAVEAARGPGGADLERVAEAARDVAELAAKAAATLHEVEAARQALAGAKAAAEASSKAAADVAVRCAKSADAAGAATAAVQERDANLRLIARRAAAARGAAKRDADRLAEVAATLDRLAPPAPLAAPPPTTTPAVGRLVARLLPV